MQRGEIRWYLFRRPDKRRPVLILTRDSALDYLGEVTIAPITTRIRDIPTEVFLAKDEDMPRDCAVNLDHVQTVARGRVGTVITHLNPRHWPQVQAALLFALGFPFGRDEPLGPARFSL